MKPDDVKLKEALGYRKYMVASAIAATINSKGLLVDKAKRAKDFGNIEQLVTDFIDEQSKLIKLYLVDESCIDAVEQMHPEDYLEVFKRTQVLLKAEGGVQDTDPLPPTSTKSVEVTSTELESS